VLTVTGENLAAASDRLRQLRRKEMLSEEDFAARKQEILFSLAGGVLAEGPHDFLAPLTPFLDDGTLSEDEILVLKEFALTAARPSNPATGAPPAATGGTPSRNEPKLERSTMPCPSCGKDVNTAASFCPHCLNPPHALSPQQGSACPPPTSSQTPVNDTKDCSFCGGTINAEALKCRLCGALLQQFPVFDMRGFLLLLEPTVAFGLLAIWYVKIPVLSLPTFVAAVIASLTVVAATTIAWDEAELSNSAPPGKGQRPRPFAWFFFVLGFWAIAYPAHMFRRRRRLPPGLQAVANSGVALLLTVALLLMSTHLLYVSHLRQQEIAADEEKAARLAEATQREMAAHLEKVEKLPLTLEVTSAASNQRINTRFGGYYPAPAGHHYLRLVVKVQLGDDAAAPVFIAADSFRLVTPSGKTLSEETESDMSLWRPFGQRTIAPGKWDSGNLVFIDDSSLSGRYELQWNGEKASVAFNPVEIDVSLLKGRTREWTKWAREQLLQIGPEALPALLHAQRSTFSDDQQDFQADLADLVRRLAARSVPQLVASLGDRETAGQAAFAISQVGKGAAAAVPSLTELAKDSDPRLRGLAILALSRMGGAAKPAFEPLKAALTDPDEMTRMYAADALNGIGAEGRAAVVAAGRNAAKP